MHLLEDGRDVGEVQEYVTLHDSAALRGSMWPVGMRWCSFVVRPPVNQGAIHQLVSAGKPPQRITITAVSQQGARVVAWAFFDEEESGNLPPTPSPTRQYVSTAWDGAEDEEE